MEATRIIQRAKVGKRAGAGKSDEEATRITRQPVQKKSAAPAPLPKAPAVEAPPAKTPPALLPLARYALVALVFGRERAPELLEGLGEREAERAKEHLTRLAALSSAERQAKVAVEFGMRSDPSEQIRQVMSESPEVLRREIFRRLPPYLRTLFPARSVQPADASATPALCALAERLIREVTR
ncbi:hypothetical protein [Hyalangium rubrum]|uniref:Flagellar motor switch protein FliG middle domain-containing protein n=1 Tax=Hyalangium rubrum TaxID=3103134 RepID=A0ABU5H788_9BACT|nr:hypothetical protein [Hyalangium sp. s54d21]MDY7228612.1 hypothetical protein [Hyalangium sp. s54d21]